MPPIRPVRFSTWDGQEWTQHPKLSVFAATASVLCGGVWSSIDLDTGRFPTPCWFGVLDGGTLRERCSGPW